MNWVKAASGAAWAGDMGVKKTVADASARRFKNPLIQLYCILGPV
jgi:hypothetical protein